MAYTRRKRKPKVPKPQAINNARPADGKKSRKDVTEALYEAVMYYFVKKTCSVHKEVGVEPWGRRRLDALVIDYPGNLTGIETKSCLADFRSDKKWRNYLPYTNQFYFCFAPELTKSRCYPEIRKELKEAGVGILVLSETGRIVCSQKAKRRLVSIVYKYQLFRKLAWREGDSKRNIHQTKRVYL